MQKRVNLRSIFLIGLIAKRIGSWLDKRFLEFARHDCLIAGRAESYPLKVTEKREKEEAAGVGLCASCDFMRRIASDRGSTFYRCERSATDARFPKYPRLPVLRCSGYEPLTEEGAPAPE